MTGGHVYRGRRDSSFYEVYIFGDYESRRVWGLKQKERRLETIRQIGLAPQRVVSFSITPEGELLLVGYEGTVYKLILEKATFR